MKDVEIRSFRHGYSLLKDFLTCRRGGGPGCKGGSVPFWQHEPKVNFEVSFWIIFKVVRCKYLYLRGLLNADVVLRKGSSNSVAHSGLVVQTEVLHLCVPDVGGVLFIN